MAVDDNHADDFFNAVIQYFEPSKEYVVQLLKIERVPGLMASDYYILSVGTIKASHLLIPPKRFCPWVQRCTMLLYRKLSDSSQIDECLKRCIEFARTRPFQPRDLGDITNWLKEIIACNTGCYEDYWSAGCDTIDIIAMISNLFGGIRFKIESLKRIAYDSIRHKIPVIKIADDSYTNLLDQIHDDILWA